MEDPELTQRRERGRMAQRAFRQRQITTIRELKGKNQELADAIENVTRAAARFSRMGSPNVHDRASLETAIKEARSLAGLPPIGQHDDEDDRTQMERNNRPLTSNSLNPANQVLSTENHSDTSSKNSSPPSMAVSVGDMLYEDIRTKTAQHEAHNQSSVPKQYGINMDSHHTSQETNNPAIASSSSTRGRVSPRLTYGIWFEPDRFIRVINPPSDIVPYLGPNINTLAGAIYWAGLGYGFAVLKEVLRMRAQSAAIASSLLQNSSSATDPLPIVRRLFGHSIKAAGPDADGEQILHDIIHARFTWRRQGYIPGDHPGVDPEIPNKLFRKVVLDFKTAPSTSQIPHHQSRKTSNRNSRRNSPEVTTNRGVEDLTEYSTSDRTSYPITTSNPEQDPEEINPDKEDLSNWLTPPEIESYVRTRLNAPIPTTVPSTSTFGAPAPDSNSPAAGKMNYSAFETAFQSRTSTNTRQKRDERLRASMLKRLVRSIADKGVCFGNSPRWRIDVVSAAVDEWMAEVEAAEQAQAAQAAAMDLYGLGQGFGLGHQNMNMATSFPTTTGTSGMVSTTSTTSAPTSTSQAWYFSGTSAPSGGDAYHPGYSHSHEYGLGFDYPYTSSVSNPSPLGPASTTTTTPGLATTSTTVPFTTAPAGYTSGGGSSSSSMYYGSETENISGGIPEGMVF